MDDLSQSLLKDEDALNESEADIIQKELAEIRKDFSLTKEKLYRRAQSYFNQSVESNYTKAEVLHELINECEALKKRYRFLQEQKKRLREFSQ